jgi:MFS transporter, ACS family, tartrate transporter
MSADLRRSTLTKVNWRLLPMTMLLFFMSLLDRTNISFAALEMNKDLGLSLAQYGLAASIFYVGYFLFEIPSNFALARVGARIWLTRIMVTWGLVVIANGFVQGSTSLYVVRFLLGAAEAGLLPGLLFYLSLWMPAHQRGTAYATLLSTTAIAYALGGPFTTWLMTFSLFDLRGWQTMYVVQGVLTVLIGAAIPFLLPNYVKDAKWLAPNERDWLQSTLAQEEIQKRKVGATTVRQGFLDPRVLLTTLTCFFLVCANFGTVLFLPQILRPAFPTLSIVQISLLISVAFVIGASAGSSAVAIRIRPVTANGTSPRARWSRPPAMPMRQLRRRRSCNSSRSAWVCWGSGRSSACSGPMPATCSVAPRRPAVSRSSTASVPWVAW